MNIDQIIAGLRADNDSRLTAMRGRLESLTGENDAVREFTTDERTAQDADAAAVERNNERIGELTAQQDRERAHAEGTRALGLGGPARVTDEQSPYNPDSARSGGPSFFRDLHRASKGDRDASDRLIRNNRHRADVARGTMEERAITTVNGAGGEFVPPLWLEQQFVQFARPGRAAANLCTMDRLPEGTDSINIPRLTGGAAVANQATQNTAVQQTDIVTDSVAASVYTVAGGQTIALQLVEQSPLNVDRIVLADLAKAYGIQIDQWTLFGTGTGQPRGVTQVASINTVAFPWTSGTVTLGGSGVNALFPKMANLIQLIQTSRYDVPTAWVMHPRRWYWMLAQSDSAGRPLVTPRDHGQFNSFAGTSNGEMNAVQGYVGDIMGLPIVVDPNVPTNLGGGTEDVIILAKWDDLYLWEGQVRAQAFEQTYANQLSLFVRLYNYVAFQGARYPKSIGTISGSCLAAAQTIF